MPEFGTKDVMKEKITDYEVGNYVLHNIADNCFELAKDCAISHLKVSQLFVKLGKAFVEYGQGMERCDPTDPRYIKDNLLAGQLLDELKETITEF